MRSMLYRSLALVMATAFVVPTVGSAHSIKDLDAILGDKEKYFQALDQPAPEFALRDAEGRAVRLADFRGKVVVLHFIYARCPDVCPLHAERIADIQAKINRTPMKELVQFITVTTDPSRDGPDVLRSYGPTHGLDSANWVFLTAARDDAEDSTRRLAKAYGHKFSVTPDGYQIHGIVTHVIDRDGRWRANFHGLKFEPVNLVLFVNALVNDVHKPHDHPKSGVWDRIRELF